MTNHTETQKKATPTTRWLMLFIAVSALWVALVIAGCNMNILSPPEEDGAATTELDTYEPSTESPADAGDDSTTESTEENNESDTATDSAPDAATTDAKASTSDARTVVTATTLDELLEVQAGRLAYNGEILAVDRTTIVAEVGGMILELLVEVGDQVSAGEVIAKIDSAVLQAQREQALAGLEAAQSQLELLLEEPSEEDLNAAKAAVNAAAAGYQRALDGADAEDITLAETQVRQADAGVRQAQAAYNQVRGNPAISALPQSAQLEQATLALEAAKTQLAKVQKGATNDVISGAYAQLQAARANLARLEEGAKDAQIRAAEAQITQAETGLYLAQLQLDKATIKAPVDGIVTNVLTTKGSMAAPGTPIAMLLSPDVKVVIPVEEFRLSLLEVGQPAIIRVDAFPDRLFEGVVTIVAPELNPATRTVDVTIRPTSDDAADLRPGMFATVDLFEQQ